LIDALDAELREVGIGNRRRRRIVAEFRDHLRCDPAADLGDPNSIAHQFANELGTQQTRAAATRGFLVLALAGAVYAAAFPHIGAAGELAHLGMTPTGANALGSTVLGHIGTSGGLAPLGTTARGADPLGSILLGILVVAPQVAFVAGTLALMRAVRHRHVRAIPAAESRLVLRRIMVGVLAGLITMVALALAPTLPGSPNGTTGGVTPAAAIAALALMAVLGSMIPAIRTRSSEPGGVGGIADDWGRFLPSSLSSHPWRFAITTSVVVGIIVAAAGVASSDPYDGMLRGLAEAAVCLVGFGLLGGILGLRSAAAELPATA
jgi:hypothetical protein